MGLDLHADELDAIAIGDRGASADELHALDEVGYVVVPAVLGDAEVGPLRAEFERLVAEDPRARSHELGTRRSHAERENDVFAVCWCHRVVLDAAAHLLGDRFQVGHVDLRDPEPGHGEQRYHPDHGPTSVAGLTATWFLDRFMAINGATRVLPRSHRLDAPPAPANTVWSYPGEEVAVGPPGSVLLRDARLLHSAGRNETFRSRRSAFVFYQHDMPEPQ